MQNLNRDKVKSIFEKYVAMIENGLSGDSGTEFLTVRELSNLEGVSLVTAQKVFSLLENYGVIKCFNKRYYLSFGRINDSSDLNKVLNKRAYLFKKILASNYTAMRI